MVPDTRPVPLTTSFECAVSSPVKSPSISATSITAVPLSVPGFAICMPLDATLASTWPSTTTISQSLISTLNTFSETRDWFDKNAQAIVIASRDARTELAESVQAMQQVRAKLVQSWGNNIKSISAAAQRERQLQTKFAAEFEQTVKRGANRAAEASATDRQELEQRLGRKPSLRTKTS